MNEQYLDDLERRIDEDVESELFDQWKNFIHGDWSEGIFAPKRRCKIPAGIGWPEVRVNEAIDDFEKMALQQFSECSRALADGSGAIMAVRCNYGTGIMPSLFGAELFVMADEMNTLPTSIPVLGGTDAIRTLVDRGVPGARDNLGAKTLEMAAIFLETLHKYPKIGRHVHLYHPDMQGPMDICELLWGSSLYIDIVDHPDLVRTLLDLITETYIRFMREWEKLVPFQQTYAVHWSLLHKGHIMLRDDSAMNLSPEMFDAFIRPYDQRLLETFGGGALHFCGKGDHYISKASAMRGLHAIAMSQPEYNNMEVIFQHTIDKNIQLLGLPRQAADLALSRGRNLKGNVHCW